jgi:hypothetical protein
LTKSQSLERPQMSLTSIILLSLSIVFLVIGVYEGVTLGIGHAYWSVMLSVAFFFIHVYRKTTARK